MIYKTNRTSALNAIELAFYDIDTNDITNK